MSGQLVTRRSQQGVVKGRLAHNHIVSTCMIPFGTGNKSQTIESLRKFAEHMNRGGLSSNSNLYLVSCESVSSRDKFSKVFMGFDSPPMYASQAWMDFQLQYDGPNTPIIDNMFHHSSAGILSFMTDVRKVVFVHMHEQGQGRFVKCTSNVCYQQYRIKAFDQRRQQEHNNTAGLMKWLNPQIWKFQYRPPGGGILTSRRGRFIGNRRTFKALCGELERQSKTRMKLLNRFARFQDLPLDLKVMIWEYVMPERTAIVNPYFLPEFKKTLRITSKIPTLALLHVNRESRQFFAQSLRIVHPVDSYGPTGFYLDSINDTVILLSLAFLRTRSLTNFNQIAEPFSRVRKLAIPWTSACWSPIHVEFMPSTFRSLEELTIWGYGDNVSSAPQVARWTEPVEMTPAPARFRHYSEMVERSEWIEEAFQKAGRDISTQLMILTKSEKDSNSCP